MVNAVQQSFTAHWYWVGFPEKRDCGTAGQAPASPLEPELLPLLEPLLLPELLLPLLEPLLLPELPLPELLPEPSTPESPPLAPDDELEHPGANVAATHTTTLTPSAQVAPRMKDLLRSRQSQKPGRIYSRGATGSSSSTHPCR